MPEPAEETLWEGSPALRNQWPLLLAAAACAAGGVGLRVHMRGPVGVGRFAWIGAALGALLAAAAWARRRAVRYVVTSERVIATAGLLSRERAEVELTDIRQIGLVQSLGQRLLGVGTVTCDSATGEGVEIRLEAVADPSDVLELIRGARVERRARAGAPPAPEN